MTCAALAVDQKSCSSFNASRKRLAENITLLWSLTETPERPKESRLQLNNDETRQLTVEREKQLADNLAFLSASTDDMLRVMAVGVEEDTDQGGMTIRLASNTGDLSKVKKGFEGIAKVLEQASLREHSRAEISKTLLRQIVSLDYARIISRLRSRHAARTRKTRGKQSLTALLSGAINDPSIYPCGKITNARLAEIRLQVVRLVEMFERFEATSEHNATSTQSQDILMDITEQAYKLVGKEDLKAALQTSSSIDPSLLSFLPNAVRKVGRYYSISRDLIDAVRKPSYSIFRHISIEILVAPEFDREFVTKDSASFGEALSRVVSSSPKMKSSSNASATYAIGPLSLARNKFESRMSGDPTSWKVHAEIQLLFYYESTKAIRHPRIICSSKSACYLCHLFVKTHGKFEVPRTHGRLYEKWLLPECPDHIAEPLGLNAVIERFSSELEAKVILTLNHKRLPSIHPNESILPLYERWSSSSTLPGTQVPNSAFYKLVNETERRESPLRRSPIIAACPSHSELDAGPTITETPSAMVNPADSQVSIRGVAPESVAKELTAVSQSLVPGIWVYRKLADSRDDFDVHADSIRLHLMWEPHDLLSGSVNAQPTCWVQIKWIRLDSQFEQDDGNLTVVDVDTMKNELELTVEDGAALSQKALAVRRKNDLCIIKYTFKTLHGQPASGNS